jgi:hypothetical protein
VRRSGRFQALNCGAAGELIILSVNVRYGERRPAAQGRLQTLGIGSPTIRFDPKTCGLTVHRPQGGEQISSRHGYENFSGRGRLRRDGSGD